MSHCGSDRESATLARPAKNPEKETPMSRTPISLALAVFAVALLAVPAALASGHRGVTVKGKCTQQSTSKMKLSREGSRIEVEFQVDQNANGVPWKGTLKRNGHAVASFKATTHAPSGSFEIRRVISGRLGADRITAVASRASGEICKASSSTSSSKGNAAANNRADDNGNDAGDDRGHDPSPHG
jgi:hypothetical protein